MKARSKGKKKPFIEQVNGEDLHRKTGKWMCISRIIDRRKDFYQEIIVEPKTGDMVHKHEEPLSKHIGHGSARLMAIFISILILFLVSCGKKERIYSHRGGQINLNNVKNISGEIIVEYLNGKTQSYPILDEDTRLLCQHLSATYGKLSSEESWSVEGVIRFDDYRLVVISKQSYYGVLKAGDAGSLSHDMEEMKVKLKEILKK